MLFPPGSLPRTPQVETKKALLLLDLQNDFVASTGTLPVANTTEFVSKLPQLIETFRGKGQVIWVQTNFRQPCSNVSAQTGAYSVLLKAHLRQVEQQDINSRSTTAEILADDDGSISNYDGPHSTKNDPEAFLSSRLHTDYSRCCLPNTEGSELPTLLAASVNRQKDLVFTKFQYSALADFNVVMQIRMRMINDIYICGSLSNIGVYATVLDAVQQGFNVTLVEDCLGYRDEETHIEAMRRMADDFGANGIDHQEMMDDLHGLLGDVIPASRYTRKFQLSSIQSSQGGSQKSLSHSQKVSQWMDTIESDSEAEKAGSTNKISSNKPSFVTTDNSLAHVAVSEDHESRTPLQKSRNSPTYSPPRKRSISERDDSVNAVYPRSAPSRQHSTRRKSPDTVTTEKTSIKKSKINAVVREVTPEYTPSPQPSQTLSSPRPLGQSLSTGHLETSRRTTRPSLMGERTMSQPLAAPVEDNLSAGCRIKKRKHKPELIYFGPDDCIGEDDSKVIYNILPTAMAEDSFGLLKANVAWQKMYHRTGEVPRLVAVQGTIAADGYTPIYRHPADESPPLLSFDETVDALRQECEKRAGHKLNHVLIQWYRNGEDNISEHSDKTLDIVRGSSIINLSLGAMRTMTLRTKRVPQYIDTAEAAPVGHSNDNSRTTQRIRLPHNSLFVLGECTNANWLHSIRADKRPDSEKSREELDFGGERISLTFRNIGTFIHPQRQVIWGQGSTAKTENHAKPILQGTEAEVVGEQMIIGFGKENHLNDLDFDWSKVYGGGFDVVNYEVKASNV